ncbi:MAG: hypothetical protein J4G10_01445 [Alphaproteobacteria bacterium]|nr:hypothetical protein [Alphaproteobacteria bacterium]
MVARGIVSAVLGGLIARGITVLIPVMVAHTYVLGTETDAFFLAAAGILFWATTMGVLLEASIVPRLMDIAEEDCWTLILRIGLLLSGFTLLLGGAFIAALWLVPWPGQDAALAVQTRLLFVELSPLLLLNVWISLLSGWLNAERRFAVVAGSPTVLGLFVLGAVWFLHEEFAIHALTIGYLSGECVRLGFLGFHLIRRHPIKLRFHEGEPIASHFRNIGLQWVGLSLMSGNPLVDRLMAGGLAEGSVSRLELIERIYLVPVGILTWAILSVMTTAWSLIREEIVRQWESVRRALGILFLGGAAIAFVLGLLHHPLLTWLYAPAGAAAWSEEGERAFLFLVWGLPFQLATLTLWRVTMLDRNLGLQVLAIGGFAFLLNAIGDYVLRDFWGLSGITAVTGMTFLCTFLLLFRLVRPS